MQQIKISLDVGGMKPIVDAFRNYDYNQDFEITISHRTNKRVKVDKYPLLCCIVNEIRKNGKKCDIIFQCNESCNQLIYAERMGFLSALGVNYPYSLNKRDGVGRFIELRNILNYYYPEKELLEIFQKDFNFNENEAYDISTVISELSNNGHMHSESKGGVMLYCQKYTSQNLLNLFIVDSGIGIYEAMNRIDKYSQLDELQTLQKSLEFGEGNGKGFGQGLFLVSQFIKINLGYLRLITGNYLYLVDHGNESFHKIDTYYKGVILNVRMPFVIKESIQNIMDKQIN